MSEKKRKMSSGHSISLSAKAREFVDQRTRDRIGRSTVINATVERYAEILRNVQGPQLDDSELGLLAMIVMTSPPVSSDPVVFRAWLFASLQRHPMARALPGVAQSLAVKLRDLQDTAAVCAVLDRAELHAAALGVAP